MPKLVDISTVIYINEIYWAKERTLYYKFSNKKYNGKMAEGLFTSR